MSRAKLTHQVFGDLMVTGYAERAKWRCRCACGVEIVVCTIHLLKGQVTSCGCRSKAPPSKRTEPSMRFKEFKGEVGITQEDQQWMQHYRARYLERYRRSGQTPPLRMFA